MFDALLRQILNLLQPIGFVWLSLLVLTALLWWRRQRGFAATTAALAVFITIIGSTPLPGLLLASLERPFADVKTDALPTADAIVLLGGGAAPGRHEVAGAHLTAAADRLVMARELYRLGKAPVIVLGGNAAKLDGQVRLEAEIVRDLFTTWGVPPEALLTLPRSGDTHDEALHVRELARARGWRSLHLVTSANHMRRASATFRHAGLAITPVPCNFLSRVGAPAPEFRLTVPRHEGFTATSIWLHEEIGWLMYRRRGWLPD